MDDFFLTQSAEWFDLSPLSLKNNNLYLINNLIIGLSVPKAKVRGVEGDNGLGQELVGAYILQQVWLL